MGRTAVSVGEGHGVFLDRDRECVLPRAYWLVCEESFEAYRGSLKICPAAYM